ncbi:glycine cleavage system aminomethyltransferase GcvT [Gemmatimonas sp.]|jgi:aminomethyltransferase|uniref:glycine cleavage system aminomethyltransferase GcvT n=1 Tax=Gemmatimonas sp. TaxID=1962908 RepID=UPI0037BE68F8
MTAIDSGALKRTPLHDVHAALGAKIVPFAGYAMPVQYPTGITVEHKAVRETCGMFDVSHMGEVLVKGPDAIRFVNSVTSNDVAALAVGQVQYSTLLRADGTIVDDLLVYRFADHLMLVINASNRDKDLAHLRAHQAAFDCTLTDVSDDTALLAVQGPQAPALVASLASVPLDGIKYYWFTEGRIAGVPAIISRTGYTGELGFELYFDQAQAAHVWNAVMAAGAVTPAGLGCRDSLRLEAGMALYGHELDDHTTPLEAGLNWLVKLGKSEPFLGKDVLVRQHQEGTDRKLVGFTFDERAIPRHGYGVYYGGVKVGDVCSGTMSPTLGIPVGTCYLPTAAAVEGTTFDVEIRGKMIPARVVTLPFYKRPGKA